MSDPALAGYWRSPWPCEDGGPRRMQTPPNAHRHLGMQPGDRLCAHSRSLPIACMTILRDPGEVYVQGHSGGPSGATSWVERIDADSLAPVKRSPELEGGPVWPGGVAAHRNGSLYVTFGRWCHRLDADCQRVASRMLPRERAYNSLLVLPDGHLVMKDFAGGSGADALAAGTRGSELVVLEPEGLEVVERYELPEGSIARLSADVGADGTARVYVVGERRVMRLAWRPSGLTMDDRWTTEYLRSEGQTFGWDAVIEDGYAWFLDDGEGTRGFGPSFRGKGVSAAPLHLVRVPLEGERLEPEYVEVCGKPNGIVANPPAVNASRKVAVGYDSGNGVMAGWRYGEGGFTESWRREQDQAGHMIVFPDTGELACYDFGHDGSGEHCVVLDIETGEEKGRVAVNSPVQCVVFPAIGWARDLYVTTFAGVARVWVE